ncbi:hypothetical protein TNCV_2920671 [Trichonephila clavipes]|nr:hypothetical protein TNCV_2920671 [Trichonephila clavipes]
MPPPPEDATIIYPKVKQGHRNILASIRNNHNRSRNGMHAIGVSSRPKLTGIVRGKAFLHVLRRRPIGCPITQTYPIMPDVMDMIESDID